MDGNVCVELRAITMRDTPDILQWRNAPEVRRHFIWQEELTEAIHTQWMREKVATGQVAQFIVLADGVPVGSTYLQHIHAGFRRAEFGIFIGAAGLRGKGVGTAAARLTLEHAFFTRGLHRVYLRVFAGNTAAVKCYEKAGFAREGLLRHDVFVDGTFRDLVWMGALNPTECKGEEVL